MTNKLNGLDHLRALAIFIVFFFHYQIITHGQPTWLPDAAEFGWIGVDLFFVLSGFLISSQLFSQIKKGERISFKTFFLKRFFRIVPAFLIVILIYFLVPFFREKESLPELWRFLTFTQNFGLNIKFYGTFSHAWSLCVEEHFYLFLPAILIVLQYTSRVKQGVWLIAVLFLLGFALRTYSFNQLYFPRSSQPDSWAYWYKYIYYPTYNRLDGLLTGVSIAAMVQFLPTVWTRISAYGNHLFGLSLCVLTGAYFLCEEPHTFSASVFGFPLVAVGFGLMVMAAVSPTSFLFNWKSKGTSWLATLSYSIYLTHKGVIHVTHLFLEDYKIDPNSMLVICCITSVIGAFALHLIIERPFMRLRDRLLKI